MTYFTALIYRLFKLSPANLLQIQLLHLRPRPGRPAQELQTGFDAGVVRKAAHRDCVGHRFPSHGLGQMRDDHFKRDAFQTGAVCRLFDCIHRCILQGLPLAGPSKMRFDLTHPDRHIPTGNGPKIHATIQGQAPGHGPVSERNW